MAITTLLVAALALLPNATIGYHQIPYYSTGFANSASKSIGLRSRGGQQRQPRSIHNFLDFCPGNNALRPRSSIRRSRQLLDASRQLDDGRFSQGTGWSCGKSNFESKIHARIRTRTNVAASTIRRTIAKTLSKINRYLRTALLAFSALALAFSLPASSRASGGAPPQQSSVDAPPSNYYLQNDPQYDPRQTRGTTIRMRKSQRHPTNHKSRYKFVQSRNGKYGEGAKTKTARRVSLSVLGATIAASSYRASLRKTRVVRSASPFGRIENVSALGNGVSVMRVCVAVGFDESGEDGIGGAEGLLKRLHLEDKELYAKMAILTQHQVKGSYGYSIRQKALSEYLSNVASIFLHYRSNMRYGSIDSIRVPFKEDAMKELQRSAKEERKVFDGHTQKRQQSTEQIQKNLPQKFVLATIMLAIKGDHTSIPLPFGIIRQRDMAKALSRIATDAKVDDCLVGSELLLIPNTPSGSERWSSTNHHHAFTEEEILKSFPELVPLT